MQSCRRLPYIFPIVSSELFRTNSVSPTDLSCCSVDPQNYSVVCKAYFSLAQSQHQSYKPEITYPIFGTTPNSALSYLVRLIEEVIYNSGSPFTAEMSPTTDQSHAQGPTESGVEEPLTEITAPSSDKQGRHYNTMHQDTLLTGVNPKLPRGSTVQDVSAATVGR